ncbi:MAG: MBL fold metallo-hydrolase, partial [Tumebacillaceae bacterium]
EWAQSLYDTVFTTIAALADEIVVLPAHYAGVEEINERGFVGAPLRVIRLHNELMKTVDREQFTERVAGHVGEAPPHYQQIVEINRGRVQVPLQQAVELETGPNRCAAIHG